MKIPLEHIEPQWWWLSFADPDRPKGTQFLGACIIATPSWGDIATAALTARIRNINPGGEVFGIPLVEKPDLKWVNRLLSKADCDEYGATDHTENMK